MLKAKTTIIYSRLQRALFTHTIQIHLSPTSSYWAGATEHPKWETLFFPKKRSRKLRLVKNRKSKNHSPHCLIIQLWRQWKFRKLINHVKHRKWDNNDNKSNSICGNADKMLLSLNFWNVFRKKYWLKIGKWQDDFNSCHLLLIGHWMEKRGKCC